jgi:hypothetical protein
MNTCGASLSEIANVVRKLKKHFVSPEEISRARFNTDSKKIWTSKEVARD